ncbi:interferon lambda-3-like [Prinia subflava]|uniref:interferon lambda-3-like n=1 Tax=Prinia subflava TaxID=208062 RepID=UPI002FE30885
MLHPWRSGSLTRPLPPQMSDRVVLVAAELNLTTAMLELPAAPSFAEVRRRPLDFFTQAREDVRSCVSVDPSHQPSGRLRHWLHKLQAALRAVSRVPGSGVGAAGRGATAELSRALSPPQDSAEDTACLRATTILHVLRVLDNLRCAALQDKC